MSVFIRFIFFFKNVKTAYNYGKEVIEQYWKLREVVRPGFHV
jgi:hypothetical protein